MRHRFLPYILMAVLFGLSGQPGYRGSAGGISLPHRDKLIHAVAFAVLLVSFRPPRSAGRHGIEWIPGAMVSSLVFAGLDELHQAGVPGRTASWEDLIADGVGIVAAAAVLGARWSPSRA